MTDDLTRYEYALVRYVHELASEEFVNIGVVLFAPDQGKFYVRCSERIGRISEFFGDVNTPGLRSQIRHIQREVVSFDEHLVHASLLETSPDSLQPVIASLIGRNPQSCFRASAVRCGVTAEPEARLEALFEEFVGKYEHSERRPRRDEGTITRDLYRRLYHAPFRDKLTFDVSIKSDTFEHTFHAGWRNGRPQVLEPISFDYATSASIEDKAMRWAGRLLNLSHGNDFQFTGIVAPPSEPKLRDDYKRALDILSEAPTVRDLIEEKDTGRVIAAIAQDVAS